jgi:hypothetical protein
MMCPAWEDLPSSQGNLTTQAPPLHQTRETLGGEGA